MINQISFIPYTFKGLHLKNKNEECVSNFMDKKTSSLVQLPVDPKYYQATLFSKQPVNVDENNNVIKYAKKYCIITPEKVAKIMDVLTPKTGELDEFAAIDFLDNFVGDEDKFFEFLNTVDKKQISKVAPRFDKFTSKELGTFYNYHFRNDTKTFNKSTLSIPTDFTEFLAKQYTSTELLDEILAAFPTTDRNVGKFPENWGINNDEKKQKIQDVITEFIKDGDYNVLGKSLSTLMDKDVNVEILDSGYYGTAYKIRVPNAQDTIIKTFFSGNEDKYNGQHIEPQVAIFLNNHSSQFVHNYCGRVAGSIDNDGYMINQYLDKKTKPIITHEYDYMYLIDPTDASVEFKLNAINNQIIDFGGVHVFDMNNCPITTKLNDLF